MSERLAGARVGVGMMGVGVLVGGCVGAAVGVAAFRAGAIVGAEVAAVKVGVGVDVAKTLARVEGCAVPAMGVFVVIFVPARRSSGAASEQARASKNTVINAAAKYA